MDNFLNTYENALSKKNISTLNDEEKRAVLSGVVQQLRNQSTNNRLCCDNDENDLVVREVASDGFVIKVMCDKCQQSMQTHFLHMYNEILKQKNITLNVKDMLHIMSTIVEQLRNQRTNNRLCCDNNENNLVVTDVDEFGFVMEVTCEKCQQTMRTHFLHTYKQKLREKGIALNNEDLPTILSATVVLLRRHSITGTICNNQPQCGNIDDLEVAGINNFGFVTKVKCSQCNCIMKTKCHDAKFTYERINESQLKPGDHICWHRPYVIWHHAIVETVGQEIKVIHYNSDMTVEQTKISEVYDKRSSCCDALYRINYQDCYDPKYTVLRARKLLNERRYNMLDRNCEHFSRWCKTGSTNSIQVEIFWVSLSKVALMILLRLILLAPLGLLTYAHEAAEDNVRNRTELETMGRQLTTVYVAIITLTFIIYLLITSCLRLHPVRTGRYYIKNPCLCAHKCTNNNNWCTRLMYCLFFCCLSFICRALCACILFPIRNIQCHPCTCCRRPWLLSCGLFWRIVFREILAAGGTLCIMLFEEKITTGNRIAQMPAISRTALLIFFTILAQIGGYLAGVFVGRMAEACCECQNAKPPSHMAHEDRHLV